MGTQYICIFSTATRDRYVESTESFDKIKLIVRLSSGTDLMVFLDQWCMRPMEFRVIMEGLINVGRSRELVRLGYSTKVCLAAYSWLIIKWARYCGIQLLLLRPKENREFTCVKIVIRGPVCTEWYTAHKSEPLRTVWKVIVPQKTSSGNPTVGRLWQSLKEYGSTEWYIGEHLDSSAEVKEWFVP